MPFISSTYTIVEAQVITKTPVNRRSGARNTTNMAESIENGACNATNIIKDMIRFGGVDQGSKKSAAY